MHLVSQRGHAAHIAKALEKPLLLPKEMDAVKKMRQQDLFVSLKRDLALVSILSDIYLFILNITMFFPSFIIFFFISLLLIWDCYVILV